MHPVLPKAYRCVRPVLERAYEVVAELLPSEVAGRIDLTRPSYRASWGGPLNGQQNRCQIVRDLAKAIDFDRVIETGTYRGTSTEFFSAVFGVPVATVEANTRYFVYSKRRLAVQPDVTVELGDSRAFLRRCADAAGGDKTVFIYLDAHWEEDLPLAEELRIIGASWAQAVVMIDDFQVPGDVGFGYDDYGAGGALVERYLPEASLKGWSLYYPAGASDRETGKKRGSCVLMSPVIAGNAHIPTLRSARVF